MPVGILLFVQACWFRSDPVFLSAVSAAALLGTLCLDKTGTVTQGEMRVQEVCRPPQTTGIPGQKALERDL
ncbi:MAG: hypothetical protein AAGU32_18140, partial [Bacillota bacterium]